MQTNLYVYVYFNTEMVFIFLTSFTRLFRKKRRTAAIDHVICDFQW